MSAVFLIGGCRDPRGVVASHDPFLEGGWLRPVVCVMHEDEGLDPARSCRRQRVCQWRYQCRGAETSTDDTRDSRYVSVPSVLTSQSVQAVHLVIDGWSFRRCRYGRQEQVATSACYSLRYYSAPNRRRRNKRDRQGGRSLVRDYLELGAVKAADFVSPLS